MSLSHYHGDRTKVLLPNTNLFGAEGQIDFDWTPGIAWDTPGQTRQVLLDLGHYSGLDVQLIYFGDKGGLGSYLEPYVILCINGNQAAYMGTRHLVGDVLHLTLRWGGGLFTTISRHEVGGGLWWKGDNWSSVLPAAFVTGASIGVGTCVAGSDYGAGDVVGTISNVQVSSVRGVGSQQFIIFGNSLTREPSGQTVPNALWCFGRRIAAVRPQEEWGISGVSETTEESIARIAENVIAQSPQRVLVSRGVNEISVGVGVDEAWSYFEQVFALLAAARIEVLCTTVCPFGQNVSWTSAKEDVRLEINDRLVAVPAGVLACVDFDSVVRDPAARENILAALDFGDGVHLNDDGHIAMKDELLARLSWIDSLRAAEARLAATRSIERSG